MSTLALLELGQRTTEYYYQRLLAHSDALKIELIPCDFSQLNQHLPDDFPRLTGMLEALLDQCAHADAIIIPNITLHETLDRHCAHAYHSLPVLHPLATPSRQLKKHPKITVFGSRYTMQSDYVLDGLKSRDVCLSDAQLLYPDEPELAFIDAYRQAVYRRQEREQDTLEFARLMEKYQQQSALVLACTELSLNLEPEQSNNPALFDLSVGQLSQASGL